MVRLLESDLRTREVLGWTGLHLLHSQMSSCSQKVRIYLREKGLSWTSHHVDLIRNENLSAYFLGINPRGLVPVLVDHGEVHIESNDIILHLEERFPEPRLALVPQGTSLSALLAHEDDLHGDLRNVTFRFLFEPAEPPKSAEDLARYAELGSGTVGGVQDRQRAHEIEYWRAYAHGDGVSTEDVRQSVIRFRRAFDRLEQMLRRSECLLGPAVSVLDIAWFVYVGRLEVAGYPVPRLHPGLNAWFQRLAVRPGWAEEAAVPPPLLPILAAHQVALGRRNATLAEVCHAELGEGVR